jgi:teichuronic acid biosynthesis glycosyltransferase TuaG
MPDPLVSIIMPSYNSENTIRDSIESVIAQDYQNWELLITDDNSSDSTVTILEEYCKSDSRINYIVSGVNGGAGAARNHSIERASGRFIAFLDADDQWYSEKLFIQIPFMIKNGIALSYTAYKKFDKHNDKGVVMPPASTTYDKLLYSNVIGCLTAVYDVSIVGKKYMPLIRKRQDMGLWLEILKVCGSAQCIPIVLAKYRTDTGMTKNKLTVLIYQWDFYRKVLNFGIIKSTTCFSVYAIKGLVKFIF